MNLKKELAVTEFQSQQVIDTFFLFNKVRSVDKARSLIFYM